VRPFRKKKSYPVPCCGGQKPGNLEAFDHVTEPVERPHKSIEKMGKNGRFPAKSIIVELTPNDVIFALFLS
jgi:hypothetical protein